MGGHRCIAPNCTSGYDSNKDSHHFFTIPKDAIDAWQEAIPRDNFVVKAGQVVCDKHFLEDQILWKREILDLDGNVLGVSHYKVPRLKRGAVPSKFADYPSRSSELRRRTFIDVPKETGVKIPSKVHKHVALSESLETPETRPDKEISTVAIEIADSPSEPTYFFFNNIFTDDLQSIDLPLAWSRRNIVSRTDQAVQFSQWTCQRKGDVMKTICVKELVIGPSLKVNLSVMGHSVEVEKFDISPEPISCVGDLTDILKKVNDLKVCTGCVFLNDDLNIETKFTYQDKTGQMRHKNCPLLSKSEKTCVDCSRARSTLQRKKRRLTTKVIEQRVCPQLTPRKKREAELFKKQAKSVGKSELRAQAAAKC